MTEERKKFRKDLKRAIEVAKNNTWVETGDFKSNLKDFLPLAHPDMEDENIRILMSLCVSHKQKGVWDWDKMYKKIMEKNKKYGDAVLSPKRFFSNMPINMVVWSRIDEKISRCLSSEKDNEDAILDIIGYLLLLIIHKQRVYQSLEVD
jgi:hypothetical protein